jgi:regulator of cell morphogenesis and NO signaling
MKEIPMEKQVTETRPLEITRDRSVSDLVVQYPQLRPQLEKLGIDYCCGGQRSFGEAVRTAGLDWNVTVKTLEAAWNSARKEVPATDWNAEPVSALVDHILDKHHTFTREQLSRLNELLQKVKRAHGAQHGPLLNQLQEFFDALAAELSEHLMKEEQILFPAIKGIDAFVSAGGERPEFHCGTIDNPIRQMMLEHDNAGDVLAEMRRLTGSYQLPADACPTFEALYDGFQALEADLHEHIHLENNILFPKSLAQEKTMNR